MNRLRVDFTLLLVNIASLLAGPFVVFKKNRVVNGIPESAIVAFGEKVLLIILPLFVAIFLTLAFRRTNSEIVPTIQCLLVNVSFLTALFLLGRAASSYDLEFGKLARVSPGFSFWLFAFSSFLFLRHETKLIKSRALKFFSWYTPLIGIFVLLFLGQLDHLSLLKEYENVKSMFYKEFTRHILLSAGSTLLALFVGLGIGTLAAKNERTYKAIFSTLNIFQVIPSLSLIGFLMIPLGYLGQNFTFAQLLGISGVGWAPAFIALFLYALYPIARNTAAALKSISREVIEVSQAIGLKPAVVFLKVEVPLAAPIIIAGTRVALIQASAGTILAALVGGGGLGVFIFLGLAQTAQDLVLLGVLPIVFISFVYDSLARLTEKLFVRGSAGVTYQNH